MKQVIIFFIISSSFLNLTFAQAPGSLDLSFALDGKLTSNIGSSVNGGKVIVQPDGKILIAGCINTRTLTNIPPLGTIFNYSTSYFIRRYTFNSTIDNTFGTNGTKLFTIDNTTGPSSSSVTSTFSDFILLSDGKIVAIANTLSGTSKSTSIIRLNSNGTNDNTFSVDGILKNTDLPALNAFATFNDVEIQTNGKIVVTGTDAYNFAVARINSDGNLDLSFDTDGVQFLNFGTLFSFTKALKIQTDGKILVAGNSVSLGQTNFSVARLTTSGQLDNSFGSLGKKTISINTGLDEIVNDMQVLPDGRILLGGITNNSTNIEFAFVRLLNNGALDFSFDGDGKMTTPDPSASPQDIYLGSLLLQPDGKFFAIGSGILLRYNSNGTIDNTFDGDGIVFNSGISSKNNNVKYAYRQIDGKIMLGGTNSTDIFLSRYHTLNDFDSNEGKMYVSIPSLDIYKSNVIAVRSNGKIITSSITYNPFNFTLVGFNANGTLDYTFGNNAVVKIPHNYPITDLDVNDIAIQPDDKILALGTSKYCIYDPINDLNICYDSEFLIERYLADGSGLDLSFGTAGRVIIYKSHNLPLISSMKLLPSGKILVGGSPYQNLTVIFRLNSNGSLDNTFDGDGIIEVAFSSLQEAVALDVQSDGKIVAALSGNDFGIARFNSNGSLDNTFDTDGYNSIDYGSTSTDIANDILIQPDGKILVSGRTDNGGGYSLAVMRFNTNGSLDNSFGTNGKFKVISTHPFPKATLSLLSDGKILLAGQLSSNNYGVVMLNSDGSLYANFDQDGVLDIPVGYNVSGPNASFLVSNNTLYMTGIKRTGEISLVKRTIPCYFVLTNLVSPTHNYPNASLVTLQESKQIVASNNVFSNAPYVNYKASESVLLNPGFSVSSGAVFKAEVKACNY